MKRHVLALLIAIVLAYPLSLTARDIPPIIGIIQSDTAYSSFGQYPIVAAGDQNADGLTDFWTGDLRRKVYLFRGSRGAIGSFPAMTLDSVGPWGANIGDFDGDSFADFAWPDRTTRSKMNIYLGGPTMDATFDLQFGVDSSTVDTDLRPQFDANMADFDADGSNELIARSADQMSALLYDANPNADSIQDLIFHPYDFTSHVPTFGHDITAGNFAGDSSSDLFICLTPQEIYEVKGQVWFYLGGVTFDTLPEIRFTQPGPYSQSRERFGNLLVNLGDVNGDGYEDLFAGPGNSADSLSYVYYGGPQFDTLPDVSITDDAITAAAAGDLNRDGYNDLIIGFPLVSSASAYVYIYYGGQDMDSLSDVEIYAQDLPVYTTRFGSSVAGIGDFNGDGVDDFAVGAVGLDGYGTVVVFSGTGSPTDVPGDEPDLPTSSKIYQNYPNPFNPSTTISFDLPRRGQVTLRIVNILGQEVAKLVDGEIAAGSHSVEWDGRDTSGEPAASGVYLYRLETDDGVLSRKMLLLK